MQDHTSGFLCLLFWYIFFESFKLTYTTLFRAQYCRCEVNMAKRFLELLGGGHWFVDSSRFAAVVLALPVLVRNIIIKSYMKRLTSFPQPVTYIISHVIYNI
jgi:hypothetical protein